MTAEKFKSICEYKGITWRCDKNMIKYNKELKESRSTKKHCEGLRKHIANLERRLLRHTLANVILSIISVATIIALFTLIQN